MMLIELELKAIGHLEQMRREGDELSGPCPVCKAGAFTVHPVGQAESWKCTACNKGGYDLVTFKTWLNGKTAEHDASKKDTTAAKPKKPKKVARPNPKKPKPENEPEVENANVVYLAEVAKDRIEALSKMPRGIERSMERGKIASKLGVTRKDIDDEVERLNEEREIAALYKHWTVEAWPNAVDTDALVRDIAWRINKHVACSYEHALTASLWVMFAWAHGAATHSPMLLVTSAEPESGKTTMLGVVSFLVPRAIPTVEISEAALFRTIEQFKPSFIIDEFDVALQATGADANKTALRGVINSGHTRGQGVIRINKDTHQPETFSTFTPKCLGMIGRRLPASTLGRAIVIELARKKDSEAREAFKHVDDRELADLRSRLKRWSSDHIEAIRSAKVEFPAGFNNRRADNWRILFAIADLAGEEYAEHARSAAVRIEGSVDTGSIRAKLLIDIRSIFYATDLEPLDRISSAELVAQLAAIEDAPWAEWKGSKPITKHQLAGLLKSFSIFAKTIRLQSGSALRMLGIATSRRDLSRRGSDS
jgi:Protein of unknown function (DUF3631)